MSALRARLAAPPPGPARPGSWRSPVRGPLLTAVLGLILLAGLVVVIVTGLLSQEAYEPRFAANRIVHGAPDLLPGGWPTSPSWLYAATQGLHVTGGMLVLPFLLAKLWSVIPRLFAWPPLRSPAQALERLTLLALVGGAAFQFATGIVNAGLWYPFDFSFVVAHYWGAWVFIAALVAHVAVKAGTVRSALATRRAIGLGARPEPYVEGGLAPPDPAPATITRRGVIGLAATASGAVFVAMAGQTIGGPLRSVALLAPRGSRLFGDGPNAFAVNKTAATAGIRPRMVGPAWRLQVGDRAFSRAELLELELVTAALPIACVEGWSTTQPWTGVRLRDLVALGGLDPAAPVRVRSLQPRGAYRVVILGGGAVVDPRSLLALRVGGADLSLDHGYPARIIVPALPGVHNTKWVGALEAVT
jgi:DMSO/TMAO reductase YedYZ molybdopterin-dependent catalytic subunit